VDVCGARLRDVRRDARVQAVRVGGEDRLLLEAEPDERVDDEEAERGAEPGDEAADDREREEREAAARGHVARVEVGPEFGWVGGGWRA
jgi:hypothetical protein